MTPHLKQSAVLTPNPSPTPRSYATAQTYWKFASNLSEVCLHWKFGQMITHLHKSAGAFSQYVFYSR